MTAELARRPPSRANLEAENQALRVMARQLAGDPQPLLQTLARLAVELCHAGTAGVSLLERDESGEAIFRWVALAGAMEQYAGGTTPRAFSPCGACLERGSPQLFAYPARLFTYFDAAQPAIVEGLVVPLGTGDRVLGTIWIVSHDEARQFTAEDVRIMTSLAEFTAPALVTLEREQRLARQAEALAQADRQKDQFLALLGHELRNPLGAISNAVHLLEHSGLENRRAVRSVMIIDRQVRQLTRLTEDLMDLARIAQGKMALRMVPLDLRYVVGEAVETCRSLLDERGQTLSLDLPTAPVPVEGDAVRLQQVVTNLISNASKFTDPAGQVAVSVETDGDEVALRVRDSGIGIPAEMLPQIFDPFTQEAPARDEGRRGLGLGLALVRRFVELHGGTVTAESEGRGKGSLFLVRLPLRRQNPVSSS